MSLRETESVLSLVAEIELLRQKLADALEDNHRLATQTETTIIDLSEYVNNLEQQLATMTAHNVMLRGALERVRGHGRLYNLFSCVGGDSYDPECANLNAQKCRAIAEEALAIQPDYSALRAWLGEPIAKKIKYGALQFLAGYSELPPNTELYSQKGI